MLYIHIHKLYFALGRSRFLYLHNDNKTVCKICSMFIYITTTKLYTKLHVIMKLGNASVETNLKK